MYEESGTAKQVFGVGGGGAIFGSVIFVKLFFVKFIFIFAKKVGDGGGGGGLFPLRGP